MLIVCVYWYTHKHNDPAFPSCSEIINEFQMSVVLIGIFLPYCISQITSIAYLELYVKLSLQQQVNC